MEEQAKRRFAALLTVLFGIAYFFLFPRPLHKVLDFDPVWASALEAPSGQALPSAGRGGHLHSFALGTSYGYFDTEGGLRYLAEKTFGVSLSDQGFAAYDRAPASITWRDTSGVPRFVTKDPGYPFMAGGRRFLVAGNQATISEIGDSGELIWKRDFPSIVTAFDANSRLAIFGTLDGHVIGIDARGKELFSFAPGGSRIEGIFGCCVSPDARTLAVVAGLDRQRLVVLELRDASYRVTYHRYLDSDFRRPVAMAFSKTGREMLFEAPKGLGIYDVAGRVEHLVFVDEPSGLGAELAERNGLLILESGSKQALVLASPLGQRLYAFDFSAAESHLILEGDSVFLGLRRDDGSALLRLDFGEE